MLEEKFKATRSPSQDVETSLNSVLFVTHDGKEWHKINGVAGYSLGQDRDVIDVTSMGDLYKQAKPGRIEGSVSFRLGLIPTDEDIKKIVHEYFEAGKELKTVMVTNSTSKDAPCYLVAMTITKCSYEFGNGEKIEVQIEGRVNGKPATAKLSECAAELKLNVQE